MKALTDAGYKCWNTNKDQYGTTEEWQARVDIRDGFDESIPLCSVMTSCSSMYVLITLRLMVVCFIQPLSH